MHFANSMESPQPQSSQSIRLPRRLGRHIPEFDFKRDALLARLQWVRYYIEFNSRKKWLTAAADSTGRVCSSK
jgi:hypothetical protein